MRCEMDVEVSIFGRPCQYCGAAFDWQLLKWECGSSVTKNDFGMDMVSANGRHMIDQSSECLSREGPR